MRRRDFTTLLVGAASAPALSANAQPSQPIVGFLRSTPLAQFENLTTAFRQGLSEAGFVEGRNVRIEYRSADNQPDRLPDLASDLLRQSVAVIVGDSLAALAAMSRTSIVPIVFATGGDPVRNGLVASLSRLGGNVTGVSFFGGQLGGKRLELLRQTVRTSAPIGVLVVADNPTSEAEREDLERAAQPGSQRLVIVSATNDQELETAFQTMIGQGTGALLVGAGTFLNSRRERIVALAEQHELPAIYSQRNFVTIGGLMSYGTSLREAYLQVGSYAGRILSGQKPADLPVMQSTRFELVINLKTAKALRLEFPTSILALAEELIE